MAGQQVQEILRKLNAEMGINWVKALPAVLSKIHDAPGDSGLSPYQIVFERERTLPNIPYQPPHDCEDAQNVFQRMKEIDERVARILNEKHEKLAERANLRRASSTVYQEGQKVWYRRPERSGDKLDSRWLGPAVIVKRIGEHGYLVKLDVDKNITAHISFLKPYVEDEFSAHPKPLFFHQRTVPDLEATPDEWVVDKVVGYRVKDGNPEFQVHWEGYDESQITWEPANHFFHRYSSDVIKYCVEKGIPLDVTKFLSPHPIQRG